MTDLEPLNRFQNTFGGRLYGPYMQKLSTKPQWMLLIGNRDDVLNSLEAMYDHLSSRRRDKVDEIIAMMPVKKVAA